MKKELSDLLVSYMNKIEKHYNSLKEEEEQLSQRLKRIKEERAYFIQQETRAEQYKVDSETCPICFVNHGISAKFKPISSDNEFDKFKCSHCGYIIDTQ